MNHEVKDLKHDEKEHVDVIRRVIPALALILIGEGLLANNFLDIQFDTWWALFFLVPVIILFYQVWRDYQANGRFTRHSIGPLIGGLFVSSMVATFFFDLDWGQLWPVVFIFGGIGALLSKRASA